MVRCGLIEPRTAAFALHGSLVITNIYHAQCSKTRSVCSCGFWALCTTYALGWTLGKDILNQWFSLHRVLVP
jgi:hypothetical protein